MGGLRGGAKALEDGSHGAPPRIRRPGATEVLGAVLQREDAEAGHRGYGGGSLLSQLLWGVERALTHDTAARRCGLRRRQQDILLVLWRQVQSDQPTSHHQSGQGGGVGWGRDCTCPCGTLFPPPIRRGGQPRQDGTLAVRLRARGRCWGSSTH